MQTMLKRAVLPLVLALAVAGQVTVAGKPGGGKPPSTKVDHKALQPLPIKLGTSGGNISNIANNYCASGTLGALLQDSAAPPKLYVLSNSHVLAHDIANSGGDPDVAAIGDGISQPGLVDTRCGATASNLVANLMSLSSIATAEPFSNVDAAVGEATAITVDSTGAILEIGPISSTVLPPVPGQTVKKSGRTTGLTKSTIDAINAEVTVQYDNEPGGTLFTRTYTGQILVKNRGSRFLNSGDSGSLMVEGAATAPRPIGLLFAGSSSIAVANPAQDVLDYLSTDDIIYGGKTGQVTFVGSPSALSAPLEPTDLARALGAQNSNAAALRRVPGSVGHAVSEENGRAIIKVLVEEITPEAQRATPAQIDGVRVVLEAVGRIVGF